MGIGRDGGVMGGRGTTYLGARLQMGKGKGRRKGMTGQVGDTLEAGDERTHRKK